MNGVYVMFDYFHTCRVISASLTASAANTDFPATGIPCNARKWPGSSTFKLSLIAVSCKEM